MSYLKSATMTFSTNTNFGILEVVAQPVDKPLIKELKIYLNFHRVNISLQKNWKMFLFNQNTLPKFGFTVIL
jgi:hypothetical protein